MIWPKRFKERIEEKIDKILQLLVSLRGIVRAKGRLSMVRILVGGKGATFTYTGIDANGKVTAPKGGKINFASDAPGFASVDNDSQVLNPNGSVSCQVTAINANADGSDTTATISGTDPDTGVAAADVITVGPAPVVGGVIVSATGVLTANV